MPKPEPDRTRELAALDAALAGEPVEPEHADLAALALLVREARPDVPPDVGRRLDARVAARSGAPGARRGLRGWPFPLLPALAVAASLLVALVVALPLVQSPDRAEERMSSSAARSAADETAGGGASGTAGDGAAGERSLSRPAPILPTQAGSPRTDGRTARRVERSAALTLAPRPQELERVADGVVRVADDVGGFVSRSSVTAGPLGGSAEFSLRVPAAELGRALARLSRLAHVRERTQDARDVTRAFVSARDRLADATAERAGLRRQLAGEADPAAARRLRSRLRRVARRVAAARVDAARTANRTRFATIAVTLAADGTEGAAAQDDGVWTPADAARDALRVLEVAAGIALLALAVALPLALLAAAGLFATRLGARRRRERALDAV